MHISIVKYFNPLEIVKSLGILKFIEGNIKAWRPLKNNINIQTKDIKQMDNFTEKEKKKKRF